MKNSAGKGDQFRDEATKALNKKSLFSFLDGGSKKFEEASELFTKAGNAYKLANDHDQAGEMFTQAAECYKKTGSGNLEACNSYVEAGNSYKKTNPIAAIQAYEKAIDMYNEGGRFAQSARYYKEIAEIYEKDGNTELAMNSYQEAANIFENDNKRSAASQCIAKVAAMATANGDYNKAAEMYEKMGRESMESNLGKYSAKGHFFLAVLCYMALGDNVGYKQKMEEYKGVDYTMGSSREGGFLDKIAASIDSMSVDAFEEACAEFDRITPLDPLKTELLLKIKTSNGLGGGDSEAQDVC